MSETSRTPMADFPQDVVERINAHLGGLDRTLGLRFVQASHEEFVAELEIDERHHQPYGLVHGGVYAAMIETLCSTGAALSVLSEGKNAVGLENSTSFLRSVRSGKLRGTARPLSRGRRTQVWEAHICDEHEQLVATGRVRLMVIDPR
jgi:1,4-dihydroxy-2-naphthoyl-CoA hydrolase